MDWKQYFIQGIELLFLGIGTYWDIRDRELPIVFLVLSGILGIGCNVVWKYQSFKSVILGCAIGVSVLFTGWVTKEAFGYGDGIGLVILGIFEGIKGLIPIVIAAFLLSGIYGFWSLWGLKKSGKDEMPFFPFLMLAFTGVRLL